jgi:hypothetical protein
MDDAAEGFFKLAEAKRAEKRKAAGLPEEKPADRVPDGLETHLQSIMDSDPPADLEDRSGEPIDPLADPPVDPPADDVDDEPPVAPEGPDIPLDTRITLANAQEVSFQDLQDGYMRQTDYTAKTQELGEQRRLFETKVNEAYQAFENQIQNNARLAQQLEAHLRTVMPDPQVMERLRMTDPGEYAARMEDMRSKQAVIQRAVEAKRQAEAEAARRVDEQRAANVPRERAALAAKLPVFKQNFDREYDALTRYVLASDGGELRPEEWDLVDDHRYVTLAWKAREYDRATRKTAPAVRRKLAAKPRRVRSGSPRDTGEAQRSETDAAMAHLEANPDSREAVAAAFLAKARAKRARGQASRGRT